MLEPWASGYMGIWVYGIWAYGLSGEKLFQTHQVMPCATLSTLLHTSSSQHLQKKNFWCTIACMCNHTVNKIVLQQCNNHCSLLQQITSALLNNFFGRSLHASCFTVPCMDPQDAMEAQDRERDPTDSTKCASDETKDKGEDSISSKPRDCHNSFTAGEGGACRGCC